MHNEKQLEQKKNIWLTFLAVLVAGFVLTMIYAKSPWFVAAVIFAGFITGMAVIAISATRKVGDTHRRIDAGHRN